MAYQELEQQLKAKIRHSLRELKTELLEGHVYPQIAMPQRNNIANEIERFLIESEQYVYIPRNCFKLQIQDLLKRLARIAPYIGFLTYLEKRLRLNQLD